MRDLSPVNDAEAAKAAQTAATGLQQTSPLPPSSSLAPKNPVLPGFLPFDEELRIARLKGYEILDTDNDPLLDQLTSLAAMVCEVPIALISLVDRDRQWFKSAHGVTVRETNRELSACSHAILSPEDPFIVTDFSKDPRFASNPLVTGESHFRFYAGIPLVDDQKTALGSFCVIDREPKSLTGKQLAVLRKLASITMDRIQDHRNGVRLTRLLRFEKEVYKRLLSSTKEIGTKATDLESALTYLLEHLDDGLGWLSLRVRNLSTGVAGSVRDNEKLPRDPEVAGLWPVIDGLKSITRNGSTSTEAISPEKGGSTYMYTLVPVMMRGKTVAQIDIIFPGCHGVDHGIEEIFDLMASNLSIIAERELLALELKRQASHDPLTGAANRRLIIEAIKDAVRECNPLEPDTVLLFFDVDGFKEVNDNFGHDSGDRLLQEITRRLQGVCREKDLLGRLSGDEFVLLARAIDVEEGLAPLLERIQRNLSTPYMLGDLEIRVHSSIGCAVVAQNDVAPNEMLRRAEEAMYLVKNGERRGFCIADEQVVREFKQKRLLERNVKQAFRDGETFALFQPIIDLRSGDTVGCETLVRLRFWDGTTMTGRDFFPIIQRSRFQIQLDEFALAETLRCFRTTEGARLLENPAFRFTVNVSAAYLTTSGYAENCLRALADAGIPPSRLCVEITECMILPSERTVIHNLALLRERGVLVALDDFGTGYSNLQQLAGFPIDILKIDREFISGIAEGDMTRNSLLEVILGIGKNLGHQVIAEGVEEQFQADYLKSLGCDYAQGYLYGKPMPIGELLTRISRRPHGEPGKQPDHGQTVGGSAELDADSCGDGAASSSQGTASEGLLPS